MRRASEGYSYVLYDREAARKGLERRHGNGTHPGNVAASSACDRLKAPAEAVA